MDLERFLEGPIFEPLRESSERFREVTVDPRAGTIAWPNGADIDPDVLHKDLTPTTKLIEPIQSQANVEV